jgi:[acyl-carrier-protein] S-malonyltransferase
MNQNDHQKTIFLYPGQGAQQVGMGLDLYESYDLARDMFRRADAVLGFSLSRLCFEGPEEDLNRDLNAQLAVFTVSCIITDILKSEHIVANVASGYSAGFYGAAYAAGCFRFEDGLEVVRRAGSLLLEDGSGIEGRMAVIFGLSRNEVGRICEKAGRVEMAIFNTSRQVIISGLAPAVTKALALANEAGALDTYILPVETAYHSILMTRSSRRFVETMADIPVSRPAIDLVSYTSLKRLHTAEELVTVMANQLSRPVFWVDLLSRLRNRGKSRWFEIGPGTIISRTVRWADRRIEIMNTDGKEKVQAIIRQYRKGKEND